MKILSSPDTKRIEPQPYDGRRIEKVAEGWLVLNGAFYRQMMGLATRREYKRVKQAEYRAKKRGKQLPGEAAYVRAVEAGASAEELAWIAGKVERDGPAEQPTKESEQPT